jgi:hypothetical protein
LVFDVENTGKSNGGKFGLDSAVRAPHGFPSYLWAISKRNVV